jgi:hypothetical protein
MIGHFLPQVDIGRQPRGVALTPVQSPQIQFPMVNRVLTSTSLWCRTVVPRAVPAWRMIPKKPALGLDPRVGNGFRARSCASDI